jgi:hypothetical protein
MAISLGFVWSMVPRLRIPSRFAIAGLWITQSICRVLVIVRTIVRIGRPF